ncbi:MAG: hypothetical protein DRG78_18685 [Epsilonproteobacteria bacterium]|nr:MAG: hypothetical protein DRG78_18685 [Campylobacterota bacterium]
MMSEELPIISEQSIKSLELSSNKNNKLLVIFYLSTLYIFVSVLNTTDLMLLLPVDTFKMPLIGFELDLIYFYVLAPLILILLHFNILFNYHEHLRKLDAYKGEFTIETIDSSMYNYVYISLKHGLRKGKVIKVVLWLLVYLFPLLVFVAIYQRFADYHHQGITLLHLIIILIDIILICFYLYVNSSYLQRTLSFWIFVGLSIVIGILELSYFSIFFYPLVSDYESKLISKNKNWYAKKVCSAHRLFLGPDRNQPKDCFPRIVVTDKDIVKISKSSMYIPSLFSKYGKMDKDLILRFGARVNLANRNLRYANLQNCILTRADMHNTQLQAANLNYTHLQAVKFDNAKLQDANMREVKLQKAEFINTQLQGASLVSADMTRASFYDESNLSYAHMQGTTLLMTEFGDSYLVYADFRSAKLNETEFFNVNLRGASFKKAKVTNVLFSESQLESIDFSGAHLTEVKFFKDNLSGALFQKAKLSEVSFNEGNLTTVDFSDIDLAK